MKKILSFLLLGMLSIGMTWATDPDLSIGATSQTTETFLKEYSTEGITISSSASYSSGAVQIGNTASAYDQHYLQIEAGQNIEKVSFLISGNGSNKSIQAPVFGWASTPSGNTADTYCILDPLTVTANSYAAAQWFEYDFSSSNVKYLRIYRTTKNISSTSPAYTGSSTALGSGQTIKIYGIKVWLKAASAPTITTDLAATANVAVDVAQTFSIVASGATSYQWYTCDDALKTNPAAIDGATAASYNYTAAAAGTIYLYCVATNAIGSISSSVCAVTASVVAIHSVTYAWGIHNEIPDSILPTQTDVAEGYNFTIATPNNRVLLRFNGWSDGVNTYAAGAEYTMGTNDVTLTAQWDEVAQTSVSAATTWDWANAGSSSHQLGDATYPKNTDEFVMANLSGIPNDANFNSQALLVTTQFANRGNSHYFQGNVIKFNTTVPGTVIVWFQNTSNRSDSQANRRFVYVNGINSNVYSLRQDAWVETPAMAVAAGEVIINAFTGEEAATMVRIQKIEFHPDVEITLGANGYSTYAAGNKYTVSGATAYTAVYNGSDAVTLSALAADAVIPANAGIILKGTEGETATIAYSNDEAIEIADNDLVGVVTPIAATEGMYVLSTNAGVTAFNPCQVGLEIPAHKAYLSISSNAPSIIRIIENATNIENVEANEEAVKFIENGKLYIMKNGVLYNAVGAVVK